MAAKFVSSPRTTRSINEPTSLSGVRSQQFGFGSCRSTTTGPYSSREARCFSVRERTTSHVAGDDARRSSVEFPSRADWRDRLDGPIGRTRSTGPVDGPTDVRRSPRCNYRGRRYVSMAVVREHMGAIGSRSGDVDDPGRPLVSPSASGDATTFRPARDAIPAYESSFPCRCATGPTNDGTVAPEDPLR